MRRHGNRAQMKEQLKTPEKELNKMEMNNLSEAVFKTLVIRMLKELSEDFKHKKDSGGNEGNANENKEKFTGNEQ